MRRARGTCLWIAIACLSAGVAPALETDQFYAWGQPLEDVTDVLNAKVNIDIAAVLEQVNANGSGKQRSCRKVARKIGASFQVLIFHDIELWANNSPLVDRIPFDHHDEREFRKRYLMSDAGPFDMGGWIPPSPTIEIDGVRLGTDKLAHFFSEGLWYYRWYRKSRDKGYSHEESERRALHKGIISEKTILGLRSSGVFSVADLEANFQGLRFLSELCFGEPPRLEHTGEGWRMRRPFDFREYVTPEWDESYQPSAYTRRRWRKVRPILLTYCPLLETPEVKSQRERYRQRDRLTTTEKRVNELVEAGKLPDPRVFSLDWNCPSSPP